MYYTSFPLGLGQEYRRKMVSNFVYLIDRINTMEKQRKSHSTTDKHAHKASQIDYGLTNVNDHLKYYDGRVNNLVLGPNNDSAIELKDSRVDMLGEAHPVVSERLYTDFLRQNNKIEDIDNRFKEHERAINETDVSDVPTLTHSLDSTLALQSFLHDESGISGVRLEPVKRTSVEDYRILRFTHSGDRYDDMRINGGTHLENIGFKDGWYYSPIFSSDKNKVKIIAYKFKSKATIDYTTADNDYLKSYYLDLDSEKINVNIFKDKINIMCWLGVGKGVSIKQYNLEDFNNSVYEPIVDIVVAKDNANINYIQGCVATDKVVYISTGDYEYENGKQLTVYSLFNGEKLEVIDITKVGADDIKGKPINSWLEPEGLDITVNEDGTHNLHLGVFTGGSLDVNKLPTNKRFKIYTWSPKSNANKLINGEALAQANLATKERLLFYGDIRGNSKETYELIGTMFNYKYLSFYYTTGSIGTHSVTVPTDRFKFADYITLQNTGITNDGIFYSYAMQIKFDKKLYKKFHVEYARGIEIHLAEPNFKGSGGTYDNHAGIHLYHIRGFNATPETLS